jgi:hypothetical protein
MVFLSSSWAGELDPKIVCCQVLQANGAGSRAHTDTTLIEDFGKCIELVRSNPDPDSSNLKFKHAEWTMQHFNFMRLTVGRWADAQGVRLKNSAAFLDLRLRRHGLGRDSNQLNLGGWQGAIHPLFRYLFFLLPFSVCGSSKRAT